MKTRKKKIIPVVPSTGIPMRVIQPCGQPSGGGHNKPNKPVAVDGSITALKAGF
jgi:hypothetical protein